MHAIQWKSKFMVNLYKKQKGMVVYFFCFLAEWKMDQVGLDC